MNWIQYCTKILFARWHKVINESAIHIDILNKMCCDEGEMTECNVIRKEMLNAEHKQNACHGFRLKIKQSLASLSEPSCTDRLLTAAVIG